MLVYTQTKWRKILELILQESKWICGAVQKFLTLCHLNLSNLTLPNVMTGCHVGSKVIRLKYLHIPCSTGILILGMLRICGKHAYTILLKLILQTRVEDNKRWQQIQNPMLSPRQHMPDPSAIHAIWVTSYGVNR